MAISLDFRPHVFGPYYLLEQIAFGGMAEIYRAKTFGASGFQRELVLKRVLPNLVENPDFLDMLSNEAKLTSLLQHGNIAQVHELGLIGGVYFMTMEYLEGVSLKELFKVRKKLGKPLTPAEISFVVSELSAGLDYAHRKTDPQGRPLGIVHCDVSPDNVLLSFEGAVKVLDFGIARAAAAFSNYKEGMVMGKFNYVAPEQASGAGVDARSDVWACGVILYEGLTGEHPFGKKGDVDTLIRIARFEKSAIEPPRKLNPAIPERLDQVVMKALAGPRDQRYPSCRHLLADLVPFVGDRAGTAAAVQRMLQGTFAEAIAERRAIRAKDDEILRELQAEQAVAPGGAPEKTGTRHLPPPARKAGLGVALGAAAAGLVLGGAGGFLARGGAPASAVVVADAEGATVRVDRAPRGKAPLLLEGLPAGKPLLVEVEAPGRRTFQHTFAPSAGAVTLVEAKLLANEARVRVETDPPGARLTVDGRAVGETPVLVEALTLGDPHRFRLELKGFPAQEFVQSFARPDPEPLKIALKR